MPTLNSAAVEVDITSLPASEQAALAPLLRAARQMDMICGRCGLAPVRFNINRTAADADIARAAMEFISLVAKGDATAVKSVLQHYVIVTPAIRDMLARLGPAPPLLRPVYRTADRLSPTEH